MSSLDLLPTRLRELSISQREIVLPMTESLEAINLLESQGIQILGWEGWVKDTQGRVGHGSAPQGTGSLQDLSVQDAARLCRTTIPRDAAQWAQDNPGTTDALHFCITVGPNNSFKPNLLRYTKAMAEKACHGFGSTTQVGLTQALGLMLLDSLLCQIKDLLAAPRWDCPDTPGSAHVPDLNSRLTPEDFRSLRSTPEGEFLLELLESFEAALNDDWLPFDLAGLPLPQAKDLLGKIAASMREHRQLVSLEQARVIHRALVEQVA